MESQDLQTYFEACVLYYCFDQKDDAIHSVNLSDLGCIIWKDNDRFMDKNTWTQEYPCPDNDLLQQYDLRVVLDHWNSRYVWPIGIKDAFNSAFYSISDEQLATIRFDESYIGMMIYNTTSRRVQYFDGSTWVRLW